MIFANDELRIIIKFKILEVCEHSIIDEIIIDEIVLLGVPKFKNY